MSDEPDNAIREHLTNLGVLVGTRLQVEALANSSTLERVTSLTAIQLGKKMLGVNRVISLGGSEIFGAFLGYSLSAVARSQYGESLLVLCADLNNTPDNLDKQSVVVAQLEVNKDTVTRITEVLNGLRKRGAEIVGVATVCTRGVDHGDLGLGRGQLFAICRFSN